MRRGAGWLVFEAGCGFFHRHVGVILIRMVTTPLSLFQVDRFLKGLLLELFFAECDGSPALPISRSFALSRWILHGTVLNE